jgi:type IV secretion system protein VirB8
MKHSYDYEAANDWAVDALENQQLMLNRWQLAFWGILAGLIMALLALCILMPLKRVEPIIIQKDLQTGEVFVSPGEPANLKKTTQEVQGDLVRYVMARETYSYLDEEVRYRQVQYMSGRDVFHDYIGEREKSNPTSLEATLGHEGLRKVIIEDIVFLDASSPLLSPKQRAKIQPIAKIDFVTLDQSDVAQRTKAYWVATVRFEYLGTPDTKEAAWANWDGFTVLEYRVDQRNVH